LEAGKPNEKKGITLVGSETQDGGLGGLALLGSDLLIPRKLREPFPDTILWLFQA
jgi:hypothetical protein